MVIYTNGQCGLYINIPRGVPVALFLTIHLKLRSSYSVKIKAFSYAFLYVCIMPASHPRGFQQRQ